MKKTGTKNGLLTTEQTIHDVEHRGFEPLTSSMPWKRATNCANAPENIPEGAVFLVPPIARATRQTLPDPTHPYQIAPGEATTSTWVTNTNHQGNSPRARRAIHHGIPAMSHDP